MKNSKYFENMTKEELIKFEDEISEIYCAGKIRAPVHLSDGNEEQLIEIFKKIKRDDWVFSTHRSHYHALLHGIDPQWLKQEIIAGNSITVHNPAHRFFSSAIMGGILPIALGVALALKKKNENRYVWAFLGDMAGEMGAFHEVSKYAARNDLPITFVIEDNGDSVGTPTQKVWGEAQSEPRIIMYQYKKTKYPHVGAGKWVTF